MSKEEITKYDLEERTAKFGEDIIEFCQSFPKNDLTNIIINQLLRSGTSVGANYCEADCAETRKDFEHKISISNKESKETKHWLRMIAKAFRHKVHKRRLKKSVFSCKLAPNGVFFNC